MITWNQLLYYHSLLYCSHHNLALNESAVPQDDLSAFDIPQFQALLHFSIVNHSKEIDLHINPNSNTEYVILNNKILPLLFFLIVWQEIQYLQGQKGCEIFFDIPLDLSIKVAKIKKSVIKWCRPSLVLFVLLACHVCLLNVLNKVSMS